MLLEVRDGGEQLVVGGLQRLGVIRPRVEQRLRRVAGGSETRPRLGLVLVLGQALALLQNLADHFGIVHTRLGFGGMVRQILERIHQLLVRRLQSALVCRVVVEQLLSRIAGLGELLPSSRLVLGLDQVLVRIQQVANLARVVNGGLLGALVREHEGCRQGCGAAVAARHELDGVHAVLHQAGQHDRRGVDRRALHAVHVYVIARSALDGVPRKHGLALRLARLHRQARGGFKGILGCDGQGVDRALDTLDNAARLVACIDAHDVGRLGIEAAHAREHAVDHDIGQGVARGRALGIGCKDAHPIRRGILNGVPARAHRARFDRGKCQMCLGVKLDGSVVDQNELLARFLQRCGALGGRLARGVHVVHDLHRSIERLAIDVPALSGVGALEQTRSRLDLRLQLDLVCRVARRDDLEPVDVRLALAGARARDGGELDGVLAVLEVELLEDLHVLLVIAAQR